MSWQVGGDWKSGIDDFLALLVILWGAVVLVGAAGAAGLVGLNLTASSKSRLIAMVLALVVMMVGAARFGAVQANDTADYLKRGETESIGFPLGLVVHPTRVKVTGTDLVDTDQCVTRVGSGSGMHVLLHERRVLAVTQVDGFEAC